MQKKVVKATGGIENECSGQLDLKTIVTQRINNWTTKMTRKTEPRKECQDGNDW